MSWIAFIRHAPTEWNAKGRLQGRRDITLSTAGAARVRSWRLSDDWQGARWFTSPLRRAVQTAQLLGQEQAEPAAALSEMDWGDWEDRTLAGLRAEFGAALTHNENRGLDFRPPGGESPREVRARLQVWLGEIASVLPVVAITHKGVIRAGLSLATSWDMRDLAPTRLHWNAAHVFTLDHGQLRIQRLNLPLDGSR